MSDPSFDDQSRSFLNWFKSWPGTTFHENIEIQDLRGRGAGRGIVATADIPEDTVLFTIPRKAIISVESSELSKTIPKVFEGSTTALEDADNEADEEGDDSGATPDAWVSLILVLIYEYLRGDKSPWKPYLDILPKEFDTPMFWSEAELSELQNTSVVSKIGKDEAEDMFRAKILPVIQSHADVFYPTGIERLDEDRLIELCHRMGSAIMAYAFDLENDEDKPDAENDDEWVEDREGKLTMGMVPMADILNANVVFNAHINHGEDSLTATSLRPIPAGDEVLNFYGALGNGELLRRYGYVTEEHGRYDVVEIPWELVLSVLKDTLNLDDATWGKVINQLDPEEVEDTLILDRDLDPPDSTGQLQDELNFTKIPEDFEGQLAAFLKIVRKTSPETVPDKQRRDHIILAVLKRVCELRHSQYPTDFTIDPNELLTRKTNHYRKAVAVRRGEKALLVEATLFAKKKLEAMGVDGDDAAPAAKKQKTK